MMYFKGSYRVVTHAEPTTADPDREIVDGWAEKLGLSRWYVWKTP
ncbi:MAG: hypothetical protein ACK40D_15575 [Cyanobacteriota bacterium]|jgi:hypothetical protein